MKKKCLNFLFVLLVGLFVFVGLQQELFAQNNDNYKSFINSPWTIYNTGNTDGSTNSRVEANGILSPQKCKSSDIVEINTSNGVLKIPRCYLSSLGWGNNNQFFDIISSSDHDSPIKSVMTVSTASGTKNLIIKNNTDKNLYIPYNTSVDCDTYRQSKTAVQRGLFSAYCGGCGKFNNNTGTEFLTGLFAYKTSTGSCESEFFVCTELSKSWTPVHVGVSTSDYPYVECHKDCSDRRNGFVGTYVHGTVLTGYKTSNGSCEINSESFICNDGIWSGTSSSTSFPYGSCSNVVVTTGSCGSASGLNFSAEPSSTQLCSGADSITKPTWSSTSYNTKYTWTCNGAGGGSDMTCSLNKVYPYNQYQCIVSGGNSLRRTRTASNVSDVENSKSTTYSSGDTIYADSPVGYSCAAGGLCGSASGSSSVNYPTSNLCDVGASVDVDTVGYGGDYNWTCSGINGGDSVSCSASVVSVTEGSCGSASGFNFSAEPSSTQLCSSYNSITKPTWSSTSYNTKYIWTCNGAGGGSDMTCSLNKVYKYHVYQCQLNDTTSLKWSPIDYPNTGSLDASLLSTTYVLDNYVYASVIAGNENYIGNYACKANAVCGSSHGTNSYTKPNSDLCNVGSYTYYGDYGNYWYWSCAGINGGSSVNCWTYRSQDATCGSADGYSFTSEPADNQLCGTYDNIYKYYISSSPYSWYGLTDNATASWTCYGLSGGSSIGCSATRVYYPEYQCQFMTGNGLRWIPSGSSDKDVTSSHIGNIPGDFVYASTSTTNPDYIGSYSCSCPSGTTLDLNLGCVEPTIAVDGTCGSASGVATTVFPVSGKCGSYASIIENDSVASDGDFNWTCKGANGGGDASCSAQKLLPITGSCAAAHYTCNTGSSISNSLTSNKYTWTCTGSNGGWNALCSECASGYHFSGTVCLSNTRDEYCGGSRPANSILNTNRVGYAISMFTQTRDGNTWTPSSKLLTKDSTIGECNYICESGYTGPNCCPSGWTGSNCDALIVKGICGSASGTATSTYPTVNLCAVGSQVDIDKVASDGHFNWNCNGFNGGLNASCSAPKSGTSIITGSCGSASGEATYSAPTTNLCTLGTASAVSSGSNNYTWTCNGSNGGGTASCVANKKIDGSCGSASGTATTVYPTANRCSVGTKVDIDKVASDGHFNWNCNGFNLGLNASCSAPKSGTSIITGSCGSASGEATYSAPTTNLCTLGTASAVSSGSNNYTWTCNGSNGGGSASCVANKKIDGSCGTANGRAYEITGLYSATDVKNKFITQGLCDYTDSNLYTVAKFVSTGGVTTWSCRGLNGGLTGSCTGSYNIIQTDPTCAAKPFVESTKINGSSYLNIPQITGGKVWTSSQISINSNNKTTYCSAVFSCPAGGGNSTMTETCTYACDGGYIVSGSTDPNNNTPTISTQTCGKICGSSYTGWCGAGWSYQDVSSSSLWKSTYSWDCDITNSESAETCSATCPTNTYRNGSSCVSVGTVCNSTSSTCNFGLMTGLDNSYSCGPTWNCYYGDWTADEGKSPLNIVSCDIKCATGEKWDGSACVDIACDSNSVGGYYLNGSYLDIYGNRYTSLSFGSTWSGVIQTSDYNSQTNCDLSCGGSCEEYPQGNVIESSCRESCINGYDGPDCTCVSFCSGTTAKIAPDSSSYEWDYSSSSPYYVFDNGSLVQRSTPPFQEIDCISNVGSSYYRLNYDSNHSSSTAYAIAPNDYGWNIDQYDYINNSNIDPYWRSKYYCQETTGYMYSFNFSSLITGAYRGFREVDWQGNLFEWNTGVYYNASKAQSDGNCDSSKSGNTYYKVGLGSLRLNQNEDLNQLTDYVWKTYICSVKQVEGFSLRTITGYISAYGICSNFAYNKCPSSCNLAQICPCSAGTYRDAASKKCKPETWTNKKVSAVFDANYECIGTSRYPDCDEGYQYLARYNFDEGVYVDSAHCSALPWKDWKGTLCVKYNTATVQYGDKCVRYVTRTIPNSSYTFAPEVAFGKINTKGECTLQGQ